MYIKTLWVFFEWPDQCYGMFSNGGTNVMACFRMGGTNVMACFRMGAPMLWPVFEWPVAGPMLWPVFEWPVAPGPMLWPVFEWPVAGHEAGFRLAGGLFSNGRWLWGKRNAHHAHQRQLVWPENKRSFGSPCRPSVGLDFGRKRTPHQEQLMRMMRVSLAPKGDQC